MKLCPCQIDTFNVSICTCHGLKDAHRNDDRTANNKRPQKEAVNTIEIMTAESLNFEWSNLIIELTLDHDFGSIHSLKHLVLKEKQSEPILFYKK